MATRWGVPKKHAKDVVKIGKVSLGKSPTVVLTLTDTENLPSIRKAKREGARILEIRIDRFQNFSKDRVLGRIQSLRRLGMPLIATIRSQKEGGGRLFSDSKRIEIFQKILPLVNAIDLELSSPPLVKALVRRAHRMKKQVILSYHHFKSTPTDTQMTNLIRRAKKSGADLVKIAVTPKKKGDVARLLLFTQQNRDKNLVTIAMGRLGKPSRVLAPLFGSLLTYGFLERPQAPGQLSLKRLSRELRKYLRK